MRRKTGWNAQRGWGASGLNPLQELIKSGASFLVDPRFADGQSWVKLEPRTLPNGVSNTDFTQNVSDDYVLQESDITSISNLADVARIIITQSILVGIINPNTTDNVATKLYVEGYTPLNNSPFNATSIGKYYFNATHSFAIFAPLGTTLEQARALLAGKVIRYQLATPIDTLNVPFTNPLVDRVGKVLKNLLDPMSAKHFGSTGNTTFFGNGLKVTRVNAGAYEGFVISFNAKQGQSYSYKHISTGIASSIRVGLTVDDNSIINTRFLNNQSFNFVSPINGNVFITSRLGATGVTVYSDLMLNEGDTQLPYEPYGKTNVRLEGFAGTSASGYELKLLPNGNQVVGLTFDGVNDFGQILASEKLNPTGTQDFAQLVVFEPEAYDSARYWGLVRNDETATQSIQYGLYTVTNNTIGMIAGGVAFPTLGNQLDVTWALYGVIKGLAFMIINGNEKINTVFNIPLVSRQNARIGCRATNIDGSSNNSFAKGTQHVCAFFYNGDNGLDKDKIIKACKRYIKDYF